jgi:hypothetical protein
MFLVAVRSIATCNHPDQVSMKTSWLGLGVFMKTSWLGLGAVRTAHQVSEVAGDET